MVPSLICAFVQPRHPLCRLVQVHPAVRPRHTSRAGGCQRAAKAAKTAAAVAMAKATLTRTKETVLTTWTTAAVAMAKGLAAAAAAAVAAAVAPPPDATTSLRSVFVESAARALFDRSMWGASCSVVLPRLAAAAAMMTVAVAVAPPDVQWINRRARIQRRAVIKTA